MDRLQCTTPDTDGPSNATENNNAPQRLINVTPAARVPGSGLKTGRSRFQALNHTLSQPLPSPSQPLPAIHNPLNPSRSQPSAHHDHPPRPTTPNEHHAPTLYSLAESGLAVSPIGENQAGCNLSTVVDKTEVRFAARWRHPIFPWKLCMFWQRWGELLYKILDKISPPAFPQESTESPRSRTFHA